MSVTAAPARERQILFSEPMVRALLAGTKTQTRRTRGLDEYNREPDAWIVDPDWTPGPAFGWQWRFKARAGQRSGGILPCPYGKRGDRLWVRETVWRCELPGEGMGQGFLVYNDEFGPDPELGGAMAPRANTPRRPWARRRNRWGRCPSIHMPRWACRIVLELTDVRVERLQAISESDARAEGIAEHATCYYPPTRDGSGQQAPDPQSTARSAFAVLWDDVNGSGAWDANPWVWVLSFRRVTA